MDCLFFIAWMICSEGIQNIICSKIDQELSNKQEQSEIKEPATSSHSEQTIDNDVGFPFEPKTYEEAHTKLSNMKHFLKGILDHGKYDVLLLLTCFEIDCVFSDLLNHFRKQVLEYYASPTTIDSGSVRIPENFIKLPIFTLDKQIENLYFLRLIQIYLNSDYFTKFIITAASIRGKNTIKMFLKLCNKKWDEIQDMTELETAFQREIRGFFINLSFYDTIGCDFVEGNVFMDYLYRELLELVCFKYYTQKRIGVSTYSDETHYILAFVAFYKLQTTESANILRLSTDESMIIQGCPKIIIISGSKDEANGLKTKTLDVYGKEYKSRNEEVIIKVQVQKTDHELQIVKSRRNNDENTHRRDDQNMSTRDLSYVIFEEQENE